MSATLDELSALSAGVRQLHACRKAQHCTDGESPEPRSDPPNQRLLSGCRAKGGPYHTRHSCEPLCIDHRSDSRASS